MRLRSLELDQFRKFDRPMRLEGLSDGINVLCAPNEFGKSTLLAAIRAVLFDRHGSKTAAIRGYQPRAGGAAPRVALCFEHDGTTHRIEKRFLQRPQAILRSGNAVFEADAAEERLAALLGVASAQRGARDAASIWDALLVDQGSSFSQAELSDSARATLSDCLQAELGAVSGGVAIARVLKPVQTQLAERLDGHGRPRDRFKQAMADREAAAAELAALGVRKRALLDDLSALVDARRSLAQASDPAAGAAARDALREARAHRDALLGQRDRVGQATTAVELAERALATLREARAARIVLVDQIDANARSLRKLGEAEAEARRRLADATAALDAGRGTHQAAERRMDDAAMVLRDARARREKVAQAVRHARLRDRLGEAEALAARIAAGSARLDTLAPDETGIVALRQAALDDRADRAAVLAQATTVGIALSVPLTLQRPGLEPILLPAGAQRLELTGPATLRIDGVGAIEIVPAAGDRDRLLAAAQGSARRLRLLLDAAGCADLADAERRNAERARILPELAEARRALGALVGKEGIDDLRREEAAARSLVAADPAPLVSDHDAGAALASAQAAADAAQGLERDARDALRRPELARDAARSALAEAENGVRAADAERVRLAAALEQALDGETDASLADRLGAAERALFAAQSALSALLAAAPEGTVALLDARINRLEQANTNRADAQARERERIAGLQARIEAAEGAGLDEQIELAARRGEDAARTVADTEREIAVLSLLRATLLEADRSARERFLQPLVGRISPTLRALFPGASVALDERFAVAGLQRPEGGGADGEAFDTLSHGTREQVAILCRLAFADMLAARGHPSFLLLDDALAFADADRMDRMFDILHEAGQRLQILVLTCRADAAARLGGHAVRLEPAGATPP